MLEELGHARSDTPEQTTDNERIRELEKDMSLFILKQNQEMHYSFMQIYCTLPMQINHKILEEH